ncbi:MAG: sensor histidine kinase [Rhodospirillales bacterium]|nr:sensor histidine kinase [Rhodospirillales bacterium]
MLVLGFVGSVYFEPFEAVASFDRAHPIWHFDDVATALVFVSFGLLWLAARRAHDAAIGARAAVHAIELEHAYQALGQQARALEQTAGELALARDSAQAADRLKSQFLANMSHELRTPLNGVIGLSELMMSGSGERLDDGYRGYVAAILASGRRLSSLVDDLFDISKLEAGRMELRFEALDFAGLIGACHGTVCAQAQMRGLDLVLELPHTLPAMADKTMLTRLVVNLLSNAIKFTPRGGRVDVRAHAVAEDTSAVELVVSDSGIGMTPEEIGIALLPFRQVDGSLSRQQEGAGLGLPLAKSVAEHHGGRLTIDSVQEHGTIVRVRLPILTLSAADGRVF